MSSRSNRRNGTKATLRNKLRKQPNYRQALVRKARREVGVK